MDLVDGAGQLRSDHGLYRDNGVFHHGFVVIIWVSGMSVQHQYWNLPFDPASIAVRRWLFNGVAVLLLAVGSVRYHCLRRSEERRGQW